MLAWLTLLATAISLPERCAADAEGFCGEPVVTYTLRTSEPTARIKIRCNLGSVVAVQLPEGDGLRGEPAIGNAALFQYKVQQDPLTILLWPQVPAGSQMTSEQIAGEISNVQINLASGINVIVELKITNEPGVQRLVLDFPELSERLKKTNDLKQKIREEVEREFKRKEEGLEEIAAEKAMTIVARGIMKRVHCTELRDREMKDLLVVRAHKICHLGDNVYLEFSVHNRARDLFSLGAVEVLAQEGSKLNPLESRVEWEEGAPPQLRFDKRARAVAVIPMTEETAASEYALRVTESAGKKRVVTLKGIQF